jgi:hypothetical protein
MDQRNVVFMPKRQDVYVDQQRSASLKNNPKLVGGPAQKMSIFKMVLKLFLSDQTNSA